MKIPITQSKKWQKLQDDLGVTSFFVTEDDFQYLAIRRSTPVGNYLYLPYGPVADSDSGFKHALESLDKLAREEQPIFIRIEPQNPDFIKNLKSAIKVKDLNPADTWVLDLTPEENTLVSNFSQGTRTRYHNYIKKGLYVEKTTDPSQISYLVELQNQLYKQKHLNSFSKEYLEAELCQPFAVLYLVKYYKPSDTTFDESNKDNKTYPESGQVLAASLFFDFDGTRYYMQSAADSNFRRYPATVALLSEAIFDAKRKGARRFDFWGIAPDGAGKDHPWAGFTEFKKSFGGEAVHYAGTYDIVRNHFKYRLYSIIRSLGHKIQH